jgi:hypothetical protein
VVNGEYSLPKVPDGSYQGFLLILPRKDHLIAGTDSTDVFATTASLSTGSAVIGKGTVHGRVPLPDSLIVP